MSTVSGYFIWKMKKIVSEINLCLIVVFYHNHIKWFCSHKIHQIGRECGNCTPSPYSVRTVTWTPAVSIVQLFRNHNSCPPDIIKIDFQWRQAASVISGWTFHGHRALVTPRSGAFTGLYRQKWHRVIFRTEYCLVILPLTSFAQNRYSIIPWGFLQPSDNCFSDVNF